VTVVEVGSGATRRRYEVTSDGVRAVAVVVAGRVVPIDDRGLRLVVDGADVVADDLRLVGTPETAPGATGLAWRLAGRGLDVAVAVEAPAGAAVVRTRVAASGTGRLERVEVERWAGAGDDHGDTAPANAAPPHAAPPRPALALGQPVFGPGWFAGLEHPGAEGSALALDVDLDRHGAHQPWTAPAYVVGGAAEGHELAAFWDELDRVRACPPRMVVLANNWYQLGAVGRMDERTVVEELDGFGAVARAHGLALDWYCLDDPWDGSWAPDTGIWGWLDPRRFPGGTDALQQAASASGVGGIGLWVSPWGGYFDRHDARVAWGRAHGFEVDERGGQWPCLCPAGDTYRRHLAASLARHTAAGVGYWKLDGVQFDCQDRKHGHAVGAAGRTDQIDRFAALLDGVRSVRPDVFLAFTTGSTPSPWWLRHADVVWRGGLDDDAPNMYEGGPLDRFTTYIDTCLDAFRPTALPVSAVVTFSVVENEARAYRGDGAPEAWERHCWFLAGRGSLHHDLYVAPGSLSVGEWETLAAALAWARGHQRVLARSRMVGGRPQAGEPYGFAAMDGGDAIVCLRNPSGRTRAVSLGPNDLAGGELVDVEAVWTERRAPRPSVPTELEPFEVVLLSGRWRPGSQPGRRG
jgi:hypothetical protein